MLAEKTTFRIIKYVPIFWLATLFNNVLYADEIFELKHNIVLSVAANISLPCEGLFAASGKDSIFVCDIGSGKIKHKFRGDGQWLRSIALDCAASQVFTSPKYEDYVTVWDINTGKKVRSFSFGMDIYGRVAFSHDYSKYFSQQDSIGIIRDISTGEIVQTLQGYKGALGDVAFSYDDSLIIAGVRNEPTVILWECNTGQKIETYAITAVLTDFCGYSVDISRNKQFIVGSCSYGSALVRDRFTGQVVNRRGPYFSNAKFTPDGERILLTGGMRGYDGFSIQLWDFHADKIEVRMPSTEFFDFTIYSDNKTFVTAGGGAVGIWEIVEGSFENDVLQPKTSKNAGQVLKCVVQNKNLVIHGLQKGNNQAYTVELINTNGVTVKKVTVACNGSNTAIIHLPFGLPSGYYLVRIHNQTSQYHGSLIWSR
jgi:hypothetical protein